MRKIINKSIPSLLVALFVGVFVYGINGYMSLLTRDVIDISFTKERIGFDEKAKMLLLMAALLLILQTLLSVCKGYYRRKSNANLKTYYISEVFKKNINEFNKDSNSKYVSHITNDLNNLDLDFIDGIFELAMAIIQFLVFIVIIGGVSKNILFIILLLGVTMAFISNRMSKPLKKLYEERSELYGKYTNYISEVLNAFRIIRVNNLFSKILGNFGEKNNQLQAKSYHIERTSTFIYALQNFTINLTVLGVLGISVYYAIQGELTFGGVILIISNFASLIGPFERASELYPKIVSSKTLFKTLDQSLKNTEESNEFLELNEFGCEIELVDVSFSYEDNRVLEGVNLKLEKGKKYLIVGPSGGGKSTLLKLLRKYFTPKSGKILVDGKDLSAIKKESFFKTISNVEQNVFIFDDTLRNNLTLYRDLSDESLKAAIREAGLESFIRNLPRGLETVIEDNGRNISGGERSRIAIARALLNKSEILILDEAFQSLDYDTAKDIEETILNIKELTVLNVSHIIIGENKSLYDEMLFVDNRKVLVREI